jgi:hypothetical protein
MKLMRTGKDCTTILLKRKGVPNEITQKHKKSYTSR